MALASFRAAVSVAAGVSLLLAGKKLDAAELRWSGPESCAERESVVEQVGELLGRPLAGVRGVDFEVKISHEKANDEWRLHLETIEQNAGDRRTRELSGKTCSELTGAAAVAITMAIRASENPEPAEPGPATAEHATENARPVRVRPAKPVTSARGPDAVRASPAAKTSRPDRLRPSLALAAVGDVGALPGAAPGVQLEASLGWRSLRGILFGALFASQRARAPVSQSEGEFQLALGGLLICVEQPQSGVRGLGCAGMEVGEIAGQGIGVSDARSGSSSWQAGRAELGLLVPLAPNVHLMGRAGAAIPLVRREFVLDGEPVHRASAVTFRALAGVEGGF
jgi:hypothetical protein